MKIFKCGLIFLAVQFLFAYLFWLGGFNFDQRGEAALSCGFSGLLFGGLCAFIYAVES